MADRALPLGQINPAARPIGAFIQPGRPQSAEPARPAGMGSPLAIEAIQTAGTTYVAGSNQWTELAQALAPFTRSLTDVAQQGMAQYAAGMIEEGYYRQLKEQQARATLSLQPQAEAGAAAAAQEIGWLQKRDPMAADLLKEANPWALIGRRRALAQLAGSRIEAALDDDLTANAAMLSTLKPGTGELTRRRAELTAQVLGRFGLTGDEPETQFYVAPQVNRAWEAYQDKQRKLYSAAVEDSTRAAVISSAAASMEALLTGKISFDGVKRGTREWTQLGAYLLNQRVLDPQLQLLDPEARRRVVSELRTQIGGTFGADPVGAALLAEIRDGDPSIPWEKRPTWGASVPLTMLELQVRGQDAVRKRAELQKQSIEDKLDRLWYAGPGQIAEGDQAMGPALLKFRNDALAMGYLQPEEYINQRRKQQEQFAESINPPDPYQVEDFVSSVENLPPSAWTEDPNAFRNAVTQAKRLAKTPDDYRRMMEAINKARGGSEDFDAGVKDFVQRQVLQDLDSDAVRVIKNKQKEAGKDDNYLAQMIAGGASVTAAVSATYKNTQLTAATNRFTDLYERAVSNAVRQWRVDNPDKKLSPSTRNVVMAKAAAAVRKSPEWAQALTALTGRKPGMVGPREVGTDPKNARGVPREGARSLSDSTIKTYTIRPVMDGRWVYQELRSLNQNKPISPELANFARRANTSPYNYLLQQLKLYPALDENGSAKRWLEQKARQQRSSRTVAGNQVSAIVPSGVGGFNPLAPGGWLMRMLVPSAVAAPFPMPTMVGGDFTQSGTARFERPESVVFERPGPRNQPGVDFWFASKRFPAVLAGVVKEIGREPGYGNYVVIESRDPANGQPVDVLYGHLPDDGIHVRRGQRVGAGQIVGRQGGTGNVRSADGTIASIDFFAPRPAGSRDMTPYQHFDRLRRDVARRLQSGGEAMGAGQVDIRRLRQAIVGKESGGNAGAINRGSGALGLGQVMPENVGPWTERHYGRRLTPQQFLANPRAQLAVINGQLGEIVRNLLAAGHSEESVVRRAAAIWYSGRGDLYDDNRPQRSGGQRYPSIREYTMDIYNKYRRS